MAKNYCIDQSRVIKTAQKKESTFISKKREKYLENDSESIISFKEGCEKSLFYIFMLYKEREKIISNLSEIKPFLFALEKLENTTKIITKEMGDIEKEELIKYENEGIKIEKDPIEKLNIKIQLRLYELIESITLEINLQNPYDNDFLPYHSVDFERFSFKDFSIHLPKLNEPEKLIYWVWHKALKELKITGKRNKLLEKLFVKFKEKNKGTEIEFLFNSFNKTISIGSIRKSMYYLPKSKIQQKRKEFEKHYKFINKLANYIYKKCFVERKIPLGIIVNKTLQFWPDDWKVPQYLIIENVTKSPNLQHKLVQLFEKYSHDNMDFSDEKLEKIQDELIRLFGKVS